jgi:two-component system, cell cycle response regulator DivK
MGKTILIVEDDPLNMKLIRDLMHFKGIGAIEAINGKQGVEKAAENIPDLILMDIQLPIMDGLQATQLIKSNPAIRHIPIIALTGNALDGDEKRMMDAGCDGYISKPFSLKIFFEVIDHFIHSAPHSTD